MEGASQALILILVEIWLYLETQLLSRPPIIMTWAFIVVLYIFCQTIQWNMIGGTEIHLSRWQG